MAYSVRGWVVGTCTFHNYHLHSRVHNCTCPHSLEFLAPEINYRTPLWSVYVAREDVTNDTIFHAVEVFGHISEEPETIMVPPG
jgi:hypothetical protein